jgi:protein arginine kinase activator
MKCENCGKEEVSFHFTSNINGNITEKHLCAECAVKLGFDDKLGFGGKPDSDVEPSGESEKSFEEIFMELFGVRPNRRILSGYSVVFPTFVIPAVGMYVPDAEKASPPESQPDRNAEVRPAVDEEMKRRREINILREQMRAAAEAENYEKAAELRDAVKKLENRAD